MATIRIDCTTCGEGFDKEESDYAQTERRGNKHYCSQFCYHKGRRDRYTGLRDHLRRMKARKEKYEGLSLDDLLELWEKQGGRCAITGVALSHSGGRGHEISKNHLSSVDRIDSSQGYKKGNVQFISATMNYLKNDMTQQEVDDFLLIVQGIQRRDLSTA